MKLADSSRFKWTGRFICENAEKEYLFAFDVAAWSYRYVNLCLWAYGRPRDGFSTV